MHLDSNEWADMEGTAVSCSHFLVGQTEKGRGELKGGCGGRGGGFRRRGGLRWFKNSFSKQNELRYPHTGLKKIKHLTGLEDDGGKLENFEKGGICRGKRGRQMEEGSFIVSSLRIDSLSRQGKHGCWANQTIMASINCFLDCTLTVKFNVSSWTGARKAAQQQIFMRRSCQDWKQRRLWWDFQHFALNKQQLEHKK